jgi:hypothetical protein
MPAGVMRSGYKGAGRSARHIGGALPWLAGGAAPLRLAITCIRLTCDDYVPKVRHVTDVAGT